MEQHGKGGGSRLNMLLQSHTYEIFFYDFFMHYNKKAHAERRR